MIKRCCLFIFIIVFLSVTGQAQTTINQIDFYNFSYPFSDETFSKLGNVVQVHSGIAYADKIGENVSYLYFKVAEVLYGDLTGDNVDEAAVVTVYGYASANYYITDIYVYTLEYSKPKLLSIIREKSISKDYRKFYSDDNLFEAIEGGRKIENGSLITQFFADGAHCCMKHIATFNYKWNGTKFVLSDTIAKRDAKESDNKMRAYYDRF